MKVSWTTRLASVGNQMFLTNKTIYGRGELLAGKD